jgi:hypothetical protein
VVPVCPKARSFDPRSSRKPLGFEFGRIGADVAGVQPKAFVADAVVGTFELLLTDRVSEKSADGVVVDLLRRDRGRGRVRREEFEFWRQKFELRTVQFAVPAETAAAEGSSILLWKVTTVLDYFSQQSLSPMACIIKVITITHHKASVVIFAMVNGLSSFLMR